MGRQKIHLEPTKAPTKIDIGGLWPRWTGSPQVNHSIEELSQPWWFRENYGLDLPLDAHVSDSICCHFCLIVHLISMQFSRSQHGCDSSSIEWLIFEGPFHRGHKPPMSVFCAFLLVLSRFFVDPMDPRAILFHPRPVGATSEFVMDPYIYIYIYIYTYITSYSI